MDLRAILDPRVIEVCGALSQSRLATSFYLAGGTGLALQLGHRKSDDLDFFPCDAKEAIRTRAVVREIERLFGKAGTIVVLRESAQITLNIAGIKTSFIGYPFVPMHPLVEAGAILPELRGTRLAHPREIAAMKAYALGRRAVIRDYVDLYFLLQSGIVTLDDIIGDAVAKFIVEGERLFSIKLFLEQLSYMRDMEDAGIALRLVTQPGLTAEAVEAFLRREARDYLEQQAGTVSRES